MMGAVDMRGSQPLARIWSMCVGLLGVQFVWALQNGNTSRIFQTLGAEIDALAILWIAAPITGLIVQPVIGYWSDRTRGALGRRRPFLIAGALLTAIALVAMPNAGTLAGASLALWLLTASVNVAAEPFRALIADSLPPEQRTTGFAVQVVFIGAGAVIASAMPWMMSALGVSADATQGLPATVRWSFYIGAAVLLLAVGWTVATTSERPAPPPTVSVRGPGTAALGRAAAIAIGAGVAIGLTAASGGHRRELYVLAGVGLAFGLFLLAAIAARRAGRVPRGLLAIVEDMAASPPLLRRLAAVQFFTWFALFGLWVYATPAIAARHYGAGDPASAAFQQAADHVGVLFAAYNGVAAAVALALPLVVARAGRRLTHALCLGIGAAGLAGFAGVEARWLWLPAIGVGIAWAAILSLPYAMLADAVPADKVGTYMGIHNIFLVLPQLAAAALLGPLVRWLEGAVIDVLVLSSACLAIAGLLSLTLPQPSTKFA